jgi:hypothetical protein
MIRSDDPVGAGIGAKSMSTVRTSGNTVTPLWKPAARAARRSLHPNRGGE